MTIVLALILAFFAGAAFSLWVFLLLRLVRLEDIHANDFDPFAPPVASVTALPKK